MGANEENGQGAKGELRTNKFMLELLSRAMDLIREALEDGRRGAATRLARGNQNDTKATAAALFSAWTEFVRSVENDKDLLEIASIEDLAVRYIHLTCKRLRRQQYRARQMGLQIARGNQVGNDREFLPFDPPDPKERKEIMENLPEEIANGLSTRSPRDRLIIELWIDDLTFEKIVECVRAELPDVPISIATVHRVVERFKYDLRKRLSEE